MAAPLSTRRALARALAFAARTAPSAAAATVATIGVAALASPVQLMAGRVFVDRAVGGGSLVWPASLLAGTVVLNRIAGMVADAPLMTLNERTRIAAVQRYLEVVSSTDGVRLDDPDFHDDAQRAAEAAEFRFDSSIRAVLMLASSLVGLLGTAGVLAAIEPLVAALVIASMVPAVLALQKGFGIARRARQRTTVHRRQQRYLRELVTASDAVNEIVASAGGSLLVDRFDEVATDALRIERAGRISALRWALAGTVPAAVLLGAAFVRVAEVSGRGDVSAGDIAALVAALASIAGLVTGLANWITGAFSHAPYLVDYFAFVDAPPALPVPAEPMRLPDVLDGGIELEHVSLTYPDAPSPALDDVSLTIRPGELVALVGENGAGKSTLVKLVLRLHDPDTGVVRVGGVDLRETEPEDVRRRVGVLFQSYARYQFALRDVVRMGRPDVAGANDLDGPNRVDGAGLDERVRRALAAAGLERLTSQLPDGLDTPVGRLFPGGRDLSGGEWQRLALARLHFRDADIWILDEPTAALDPEGEAAVFAELRAGVGRRMGLVISHRFSTVRIADRIAVLAEGRLVECGTHDELLAAGGRYAHLFELQAAGYR